MIDIIYISYAKRDSNKTSGNLILFDEKESDIFCACSGGWGKGALPFGRYNIDRCYALRDNGKVEAYKREGLPWVAKLSPLFETDRSGLLIHPDGNIPGTRGCIGILQNDMACFKTLCNMLENKPKLLLEVL